jgi:hypothetical protein
VPGAPRPPRNRPTNRRRQRRGIARATPGRDHVAEGAGLVRRTHRELVEVQLAQHPAPASHSFCETVFHTRREAFEDVAGGGGLHALGGEQVLHADRHARQLAERLAGGAVGIDLRGGFQRLRAW